MNIMITGEEYNEFEARNDFLKEQYDQLNEKFQANSDHYEELVCMNDAQKNKIKNLETLVDFYRQKAIATNGMYHELKAQHESLEENNKALKKENEKLINRLHDYESQIAEMAEKVTNPDYVKFLEMAKKFQECNVGILTELDEIAQPECNVTVIENQYNEYRCDCPFCNNDDI